MNKIDVIKSWKYDEAKESISHIKLKKKYNLFIGGEFVKPLSKRYFKTINPSTNESISEIAEANEKDIDLAVQSARKAFKKWSKLLEKIEIASSTIVIYDSFILTRSGYLENLYQILDFFIKKF